MQATAISRVRSKNSKIKESIPSFDESMQFQITQEHRNIKRCPARRLAPNRKPSVSGCISSLMVSIKTMTGIKGVGVPWGTR